jgi:hypothetical protein
MNNLHHNYYNITKILTFITSISTITTFYLAVIPTNNYIRCIYYYVIIRNIIRSNGSITARLGRADVPTTAPAAATAAPAGCDCGCGVCAYVHIHMPCAPCAPYVLQSHCLVHQSAQYSNQWTFVHLVRPVHPVHPVHLMGRDVHIFLKMKHSVHSADLCAPCAPSAPFVLQSHYF